MISKLLDSDILPIDHKWNCISYFGPFINNSFTKIRFCRIFSSSDIGMTIGDPLFFAPLDPYFIYSRYIDESHDLSRINRK